MRVVGPRLDLEWILRVLAASEWRRLKIAECDARRVSHRETKQAFEYTDFVG
jgi:hypothetical protein